VNRADFLAVATAATIAPATGAAVTADITIKRDSDDLLSPFSVSIAVDNLTSHIVGLDFPTADIYRIDIERDGQTIWSTATGHKPLLIARRVDLAPGITRLASQIVDGTTDDRRSYAPGRSLVHVAMLGTTLTTSVDKSLSFNPPLAIADARKMAAGIVMTIAGIPQTADGVFTRGEPQLNRRFVEPPDADKVIGPSRRDIQ